MNPADKHVATATAIKEKKARAEGGSRAKPTSQASRIGAAVVWLLAIGTMALMFWLR